MSFSPEASRHEAHGPSCTCPECHLRHYTNLNAGRGCPHSSCFWCETERKLGEHQLKSGHGSAKYYSLHKRAREYLKVCPVEDCTFCEEDHQMRKDGIGTCVCQKCWKRHRRAFVDEVECPVTNCAFCDDDSLDEENMYVDEFWAQAASINGGEGHDDDYDFEGNRSRSSSITDSFSSGRTRYTAHESPRRKRERTYYPCCGHYCKARKCKKHPYHANGLRVCQNRKPAHRMY